MRAKFSELTYEAGGQKSCCASKGCGQVEPWLTAERICIYNEKQNNPFTI